MKLDGSGDHHVEMRHIRKTQYQILFVSMQNLHLKNVVKGELFWRELEREEM
jgi:hypothetical protein